ncbi:MFS transporter [Nocardioides sp. YIM 152588]|uniref:MFS transporter n=1 Tax=Nocardioides sp. YIM 152588 TaxID=3158259 RepID=UPI0032E49DAF
MIRSGAAVTNRDGRPGPPRRTTPGLVLAICCTSLFLVTMDGSIVHVALPSIQRDLGGDLSALQWVVDGYLMVMASLLVLAGSLADRFGRRRFFAVGLSLFAAASLLCGLAPSVGVLVAARVLQGVGAAMLNPVALAIIVSVYPDRSRRARALGWWSAVSGLGVAAGPPLGGLVVTLGGWRWVFLLTVPVAAVGVLLTLRHVPESRALLPRRPDPRGQLLLSGAVAGLIVTLIEAPHRGWTWPVLLALAVGAGSALLFVRHGLRHPVPLVDPRLFRSRRLVVAVGSAVGGFACFGGTLFTVSLALQTGAGWDALAAGLMVLPLGVAALLTSPWVGALVARRRSRLCLGLAGALMTAALLGLGVVLGDGTPAPEALLLAAVLALFGIGLGMLNPPVTATALAGLPPDRSGVAGALASTARQLGLAVGVAVAGSLIGAGPGALVWLGLVPGALLVLVLAVAVMPARQDQPQEAPATPRGRVRSSTPCPRP